EAQTPSMLSALIPSPKEICPFITCVVRFRHIFASISTNTCVLFWATFVHSRFGVALNFRPPIRLVARLQYRTLALLQLQQKADSAVVQVPIGNEVRLD